MYNTIFSFKKLLLDLRINQEIIVEYKNQSYYNVGTI